MAKKEKEVVREIKFEYAIFAHIFLIKFISWPHLTARKDGVLLGVLQRNRISKRERKGGDLLQESSHAIMQVKQFCNLPFANWRTK